MIWVPILFVLALAQGEEVQIEARPSGGETYPTHAACLAGASVAPEQAARIALDAGGTLTGWGIVCVAEGDSPPPPAPPALPSRPEIAA